MGFSPADKVFEIRKATRLWADSTFGQIVRWLCCTFTDSPQMITLFVLIRSLLLFINCCFLFLFTFIYLSSWMDNLTYLSSSLLFRLTQSFCSVLFFHVFTAKIDMFLYFSFFSILHFLVSIIYNKLSFFSRFL